MGFLNHQQYDPLICTKQTKIGLSLLFSKAARRFFCFPKKALHIGKPMSEKTHGGDAWFKPCPKKQKTPLLLPVGDPSINATKIFVESLGGFF